MSMSPIVQSVQGQTLTLILSLASLNAILTPTELGRALPSRAPDVKFSSIGADGHSTAFGPPNYGGGAPPTAQLWADIITASGISAKSCIPDDQILAVLAAALIGGGLASAAATDTAERIFHGQLNRAVDLLAATTVRAAVAAGA
jgi:hypothetical protein